MLAPSLIVPSKLPWASQSYSLPLSVSVELLEWMEHHWRNVWKRKANQIPRRMADSRICSVGFSLSPVSVVAKGRCFLGSCSAKKIDSHSCWHWLLSWTCPSWWSSQRQLNHSLLSLHSRILWSLGHLHFACLWLHLSWGQRKLGHVKPGYSFIDCCWSEN